MTSMTSPDAVTPSAQEVARCPDDNQILRPLPGGRLVCPRCARKFDPSPELLGAPRNPRGRRGIGSPINVRFWTEQKERVTALAAARGRNKEAEVYRELLELGLRVQDGGVGELLSAATAFLEAYDDSLCGWDTLTGPATELRRAAEVLRSACGSPPPPPP